MNPDLVGQLTIPIRSGCGPVSKKTLSYWISEFKEFDISKKKYPANERGPDYCDIVRYLPHNHHHANNRVLDFLSQTIPLFIRISNVLYYSYRSTSCSNEIFVEYLSLK